MGVVHREFDDGRFESFLSRLDPVTLEPRGRRADVGEFHDTWSASPDGRHVALGQGGEGLGIQIYDLSRLRRSQAVRTGIAAAAVGWLRPRRVAGVTQAAEVIVADPATGRVLRRQRLGAGERVCNAIERPSAVTPGGLLVMLGGKRGAAPRVLLVDSGGRIRAARLPAGRSWGCGRSALGVGAAGDVARVVSREGLVAEIRLPTMTVAYRRVAGLPAGSARQVDRLGDDRLVVVGRPSGVSVVDTRTWTSQVVDPAARAARAVAGAVLAYDGDRVVRSGRPGLGLAAYRPDGTRLFHVLRGEAVVQVEHFGTRAYAMTDRARYTVDVVTGRMIAGRRAPRTRVTLIDAGG